MSPDPAPDASSVTSPGMSKRTQCQKPLPVGASGSKHVIAYALVSGGAPDQLSCGEVLPPLRPMPLKTCASGRVPPSSKSALVTASGGTWGRKS